MIDVSCYRSLVFDCDGVLLNSNRIKTDAFYHAASLYGEGPARALVDYHVAHGGISRYEKFDHFVKNLASDSIEDSATAIDRLLQRYTGYLERELMSCEVAEGLADLRSQTRESFWYVVSGGDQSELRELFAARNLASFFDGGIYGSPANKDEILAGLSVAKPALFLGDSQYDYEAARRADLDFCFVSGWSESSFGFDDADFRVNALGELAIKKPAG